MTQIYGIKNCDTVKKAIKWLDNNNITYDFHDFKTGGLTESLLTTFTTRADWIELINKRSTTYRNLPDNIKNNLTPEAAKAAVLEQPTLLKRPLLIINDQLYLGFKPETYQSIFAE